MLLRSSSTPILSSRLLTKEYSLSTEHYLFSNKSRTRSGPWSLTASPVSVKMVRVPSESDLMRSKKKPPFSEGSPKKGCKVANVREKGGLVEILPGGGGRCGGGSGGGGWGDGMLGGGGEANHEKGSTEAYYQKLIESNPGNPLILSNYARYLKEVRGDLNKAEEYCERAILANPNDANILSMYGDIVWQREKDVMRAETYFNQAVKAAPNDCYVMASYAHFLWDAEDEEEEDADEGLQKAMADASASSFFQVDPPLGLIVIAAPS